MNSSPLLAEALAVRTKNVELRKEICRIRHEIEEKEKNLCELRRKRDELEIQCEILRAKQNDEKQKLLIDESQREFVNFIGELDEFLTKKTFHLPTISSPAASIHDDLNCQLASVENWLMESAVTDVEKSASIIDENQKNKISSTDDGTDDLYKDLIFPTFNDEIASIDENPNSNSQRMDKHQRRFVLMRQLAEKSNKTVTRKDL